MDYKLENFIVTNSPDGGFLQSAHWRKFQESCGRKTISLEEESEDGDTIIYANMIVHELPVVGKYLYMPRGPVIRNQKSEIRNARQYQIPNTKYQKFLVSLLKLAEENNAGWVRIEPNGENDLESIKDNLPKGLKIKKAPVDVQPREILVLDVAKNKKELLAQMKQKTRYNIRLAERKGVFVSHSMEHIAHNISEFLRLVKITAKRDKITAHPENYYRKMFEIIPPEILKLYFAEYKGNIIAANLVIHFGKTATYLHGASDNVHRDAMATYQLQWTQILDAKQAGCSRYDLGGVKVETTGGKSWEGVTRFKTGFAPAMKPIKFPGCWDIILSSGKYYLYKTLRKIKS